MTSNAILCTALLAAALAVAPLPAAFATPVRPAAAQAPTPWARADVIALGERVADYQLAQLAAGYIDPRAAGLKLSSSSVDPAGWVQAALMIGMMDLADISAKPHFAEAVLLRGKANRWGLGERPYHADDHAIGQTYFWARRRGAGDEAIAKMRGQFDAILAKPGQGNLDIRVPGSDGEADCHQRWCWADAVFMGPAAWLEMSRVTGDPRYAAFAKKEFWATADYLYDKDERLFFRDSRFFDRRDAQGRKLFWSRGNGWVVGGLAHMIPLLPENDPDRPRFITLFREMAAKLKAIQKPDGYWVPSLLDTSPGSLPESSGTAFHVYAIAWGVNAGILDRPTYLPVVRKGWAALAKAVHPNGKLGWVQSISDRPNSVTFDDTQYYGAGAFLLAAAQVAKLDLTSTRTGK